MKTDVSRGGYYSPDSLTGASGETGRFLGFDLQRFAGTSPTGLVTEGSFSATDIVAIEVGDNSAQLYDGETWLATFCNEATARANGLGDSTFKGTYDGRTKKITFTQGVVWVYTSSDTYLGVFMPMPSTKRIKRLTYMGLEVTMGAALFLLTISPTPTCRRFSLPFPMMWRH